MLYQQAMRVLYDDENVGRSFGDFIRLQATNNGGKLMRMEI